MSKIKELMDKDEALAIACEYGRMDIKLQITKLLIVCATPEEFYKKVSEVINNDTK